MIEYHPYGEFIPKDPICMIVGSFPISKFTHPKQRFKIKPHEFDFFFGGEKNLLWKLIADCYGVRIHSKNDLVDLLEEKGLAIGDVIKSCRRIDSSASDSKLIDIEWNYSLLKIIRKHKISCLYFTSKRVETWFNRLFPDSKDLTKITLLSPSAQSARSLPKNPLYLEWKASHPQGKSYEFLLANYKQYFGKG